MEQAMIAKQYLWIYFNALGLGVGAIIFFGSIGYFLVKTLELIINTRD